MSFELPLRLTKECYREVHRLVVAGDLAQIVTLLERELESSKGRNVLTPASLLPGPSTTGLSPLVQAAYHGQQEIVKYLVNQLPSPIFLNHTDTVCFKSGSVVHHCTALLAAALLGHTHVARILLTAGIETETRDCAGATALCEAAFHGHFELVQLLHNDYKADVNAPNMFGWAPLHVAIDRDHREIVDYLIHSADADVNQTTPEGYSALHVAAMRGRVNVVKKLLAMKDGARDEEEVGVCIEGADPNSQHPTDYVPPPIYLAAANSRHNVVEVLKKHQGVSAGCYRDLNLLRGVCKVDLGHNPSPLWKEAFTGSALRKSDLADKSHEVSLCAIEAYGRRKEIQCEEDVERLSQLPLAEALTEQRYQALIIQERCLGSRDHELFWNLSKLATNLPNTGFDGSEVSVASQQLLLRALEVFEAHRLPFFERGFILPQEIQNDISSWVEVHLLPSLSKLSLTHVRPEFPRFVIFLLHFLKVVRQRTSALKNQYQCDDTNPRSLLCQILLLFCLWIKYNHLSVAQGFSTSESLDSLGRRFVTENLYLSGGITLLHEVTTSRYWIHDSSLRDDRVKVKHRGSELLLIALLEWGAAEVINVSEPIKGDTPIHQLSHALGSNFFFRTISSLLSVLVRYGAHVDAVNSSGDTALSVCLNMHGLSEATRQTLRDILSPPAPPPLACLCCHHILTLGIPYMALHCIPPRLKRFIQLHDSKKK